MEDEYEDFLIGEIVHKIDFVSGKTIDSLNSVDWEKQMDRFFEYRTKSLTAEFLKRNFWED